MSLTEFHLFHLHPHHHIPYYGNPCFLLRDFLHHRPIAMHVPVCYLSVAMHLQSSVCKCHDMPIYKGSFRPDRPFLFGYGSAGPDFHTCHSVQASPRGQFLFRSFHPIHLDTPHRSLPVLFHFVWLFPELFLRQFLLCHLH